MEMNSTSLHTWVVKLAAAVPAWHWVTAVQDSLTAKNKLVQDRSQKGHTHLCSLLYCGCKAQHCLRGFRIPSGAGLPLSLANPCLKSGKVWVLRHSRAQWRRAFETFRDWTKSEALWNGENKLVYSICIKYLLSAYSQSNSCPHPHTQIVESFALETCSSLSGSLASSSTTLDPGATGRPLGVTEQPLGPGNTKQECANYCPSPKNGDG